MVKREIQEVSSQTLNPDFVAHLLRTPVSAESENCPITVTA
jgi:hypothetical protein